MNICTGSNSRRLAQLAAASILFSGAAATARAADKAQADAFPNFESYIKLTGQAAAISGSESTFQNRARQPANGGIGIEDLHITKDLSKTSSMVIDGKALTGAENYLGSVKLSKNEVGTVEVGFKRFRTFYDGVGGFFPLNNQWMPLTSQELHVDRSKFWFEGTIAMPQAPVFTLRYTNELRSGQKDSTIWGDTDFTSLPNNNAPISQVRKIVPSVLNLGERHELLEFSIRHKVKNTNVQFVVMGDRFDNLNTRRVTRFPGEARPFPNPAATVLLPAAQMNNQVLIAETDGIRSKTSGVNFETDTVLSPKITLRVNGSYELIHTAVMGDRPLITSTPTATGILSVTTNNYDSLQGGTRLKNYVGNVALDWKAAKEMFVKLAFRAQDEFVRGSSSYNVLAATGTPATTVTSTPRVGWAKLHQNVRTPVLELRYTGISNLALYFNGSKRDLSGEERNTSAYNPLTAASGTLANQNVSEDHGNYSLGGNWKASTLVTLRGEVFDKGHKDGTKGFGVSLGDHYLLDSRYRGFKLTALTRLTPFLGFTTRYVHQEGRMRVTGYLPTYPAYDSLRSKNHIVSESIDWTPHKNFYAQLNANLIFNVISTIYPRAGLTPATATAAAFDTNRVLQNSDNNYSTIGFLTGWACAKDTDAQLLWNCYRATNGNPTLAALTLPFGVAVKDTSVTLGLKHRFSAKWLGHAKIGYFDSANETTGGLTNYHGPMAYLAFEHGL